MSHANSYTHSCNLCQRLVIDFGEKDDAWVERTLALRNDPNPSKKAKEGRQKFIGLMALRDSLQEYPLYLRSDETVFDLSMGEVREMASEECPLLQYFKTSFPDTTDDALLFGENSYGKFIYLGVVTATEVLSTGPDFGPDRDGSELNIGKRRQLVYGDSHMFDIFALAGKPSS